MLECMILSVYNRLAKKDNYWVDWEIRDLFKALSNDINYSVPDPKGLQGELNLFSLSDRNKISIAMENAYVKAKEASLLESTDQKAAISKWKEVFGASFPDYSE